MRCCAILMASGFSKRFGESNKLLTAFRGKPLVCHALDLVCGMGCFERIFFVYADETVGAFGRAVLAAGFPVTPIHNPIPEKGQGESALLGLRAAGEYSYYFFLPCDQPLLDAGIVHLLLDSARPGYIVEPCHHHSPSLFSASFRDELLALEPGEHPRVIKSRHPDLVIQVHIRNPAALEDIDTPADLERLG